MKTLENMITERETLRKAEKELTCQIKQAREKQAEKAREKKVLNSPSQITTKQHKKLMQENKKLRQIVALIKKGEGHNNEKIGKFLGCSKYRAAQLVASEIRALKIKADSEETVDNSPEKNQ
jgi:septal ring factor EnvC (AmiA/AmiB activator)